MHEPRNAKIQLVGGQQVLSTQGDFEAMMNFYGGLFNRLTKEVKHTGDLTRYVGYQSPGDENDYLHFFGIEVDRIEEIPEGMVAWSLDDSTRTVRETRGERDTIISQDDIAWQWLTPSSSRAGRHTGEFTLSVEPNDPPIPLYREFWMSANAYVGLQESDISDDEVDLVDYDPSWPRQFDEMASQLRDALDADTALRIEHYGSTAIPGIPAKPVIDIAVEIPSFSAAKPYVLPYFDSEMWEYWWHSEHMIFIKRAKLMGQRTHHIHMAPKGHQLWEGFAFRDHLRSHPEERENYANLKRALAVNYREDRERYTRAKTEFVREVTSKALRNP